MCNEERYQLAREPEEATDRYKTDSRSSDENSYTDVSHMYDDVIIL